jgi:hypothetical protein
VRVSKRPAALEHERNGTPPFSVVENGDTRFVVYVAAVAGMG